MLLFLLSRFSSRSVHSSLLSSAYQPSSLQLHRRTRYARLLPRRDWRGPSKIDLGLGSAPVHSASSTSRSCARACCLLARTNASQPVLHPSSAHALEPLVRMWGCFAHIRRHACIWWHNPACICIDVRLFYSVSNHMPVSFMRVGAHLNVCYNSVAKASGRTRPVYPWRITLQH